MTTIPLRKMLSGQKGVISKVKANGELGRRIRDMGVVPGTPVQIRGRAPLKDPVAIRVRDFTLKGRRTTRSSGYAGSWPRGPLGHSGVAAPGTGADQPNPTFAGLLVTMVNE